MSTPASPTEASRVSTLKTIGPTSHDGERPRLPTAATKRTREDGGDGTRVVYLALHVPTAWRSTFLVVVLCGLLGAVALAALAGARRTESAYSRYLASMHASDVMVNIPVPNLVGRRQGQLPARSPLERRMGGTRRLTRSSTAGSTTPSPTNACWEPQRRILHAGPDDGPRGAAAPPRPSDEIALTPAHARFSGSGSAARQLPVRQRDSGSPVDRVHHLSGRRDCRQPSRARRPVRPGQGAVCRRRPRERRSLAITGLVQFSWVGLRLSNGSAGIPALQASLTRLAARIGNGVHLAIRQLTPSISRCNRRSGLRQSPSVLFGGIRAGAAGARRPGARKSARPRRLQSKCRGRSA